MLRHLLLDPQIVLEVLRMMGCHLGPVSESLRAVRNPQQPGLTVVLDLSAPMDGDVIQSHLSNLELPPERFLAEFNRYKAPFTT